MEMNKKLNEKMNRIKMIEWVFDGEHAAAH